MPYFWFCDKMRQILIWKWKEKGGNKEKMRKWREIYSPHFLIKNCLILSQNVKFGTFVANVTKNLTYALWENNSGSNLLWKSTASCEGLDLYIYVLFALSHRPVPELFCKYSTRPISKSKTPTRRALEDREPQKLKSESVNLSFVTIHSIKLTIWRLIYHLEVEKNTVMQAIYSILKV